MDLRLLATEFMKDISALTSWHSDWSGLRVVVFGLGVTGFSVVDTLVELGAEVLVVAEKAEPELLDIVGVLGVRAITGDEARNPDAAMQEFDPELVVTSPGLRPDSNLICWARQKGLEIWVDIDLAWRVRDKSGKSAEWFVVTGTNGKTTTVQLLEAMLNAGGIRARACGNIGVPILDVIREPIALDAIVVELSSFQLHYLHEISPFASAALNLADDHLDWHGGFEAYRAAKAKIFNQTKFACVYNVADSATEKMVEDADVVEGARAIGFSVGVPARSQIGFVENILCDRAFLDERADQALEIAEIEDIERIGVITPHLLANVAAATAMSRSAGVAPQAIREAIRDFKLDAHRIELVGESNGIRWFDDSKATNPHAAAASLSSFETVVWVVGGLLKGVDLQPLIARFAERLRAVIVIGAERDEVMNALELGAPGVPTVEISGENIMTDAVERANDFAKPGDVVLLAPAAASMDQFKDYADRGKQFADAVKAVVLGGKA